MAARTGGAAIVRLLYAMPPCGRNPLMPAGLASPAPCASMSLS
jgi:hypothetical protein